jgi:hypothetical protein
MKKPLLLITLIILAFIGCKKPTEGINLIVSTASLFKAPVLLHFENANTSSATKPADFNVTIGGKDAALVQMGSGGDNFKASHGFLPLALKAGANPSATNPITFNVRAEIPGFAPVVQNVTITRDTVHVFKVPVIEYSKPVDGTAVLQTQSTIAAGTVTTAVSLSPATTSTLPEKATITIPAGTQVMDANNNVINAAQLKSSIIQYGSGTPAIANIFPGGMSPSNVIGANGAAIPGGVNFVTAGLLSINMTAGTTPVKKFSKPVEIVQELQAGMINFETGTPLKAGDVIPLWSLNEETGQWTAEGNANVSVDAGSGKLVAKYAISHLSGWNLDWAWSSFGGQNSVIRPLVINLIPSQTPWSGNYEVQLQTASGNYLAGLHGYRPEYDFFEEGSLVNNYLTYKSIKGKYGFSLPYVPNINSAKVVIYDNRNYAKVAESPLFNPTTTGPITLNLTAPAPPEYVNVTASFTGKCNNKSIVTPITGWFELYDATDFSYTYAYFNNGVIYSGSSDGNSNFNSTGNKVGASLKLAVGHQYYIYSYNNSSWYSSGLFTLTKSGFKIPAASNGLEATTVYTQSTNTLAITGSISIKCN